ncbi:DUF4247 domain-containing protein [Salinibacillus xinjiangensis]|uniref:DUF4247 domain-containing protein n=1 Tax=Salinibacillus xinjiangensis TaxID=1229268 RepID=A0A6G1XA00_9BACI|nr:DUF4247 domain-containing protein [Salinibacillus xinjiangensis]MRG87700.1 DUF4247 domain-containing protein [Salinibacillus xinjiangensis]
MKRFLFLFFLSLLFLSGCNSIADPLGFTESSDAVLDTVTKEEVQANIKNENYTSIEDMLDGNFTLVDVISEGTNQTTNIFATRQFTLNELSSLIQKGTNPDEVSEVQDNKQILIYNDEILTLQVDEKDPDLVLAEVATKEFVREHYSPNYFNGFFALWVLDEVLDVDDWGKKRANACKQGNCYGGYFNTKKYRSGDVGSLRSSSSRGGGLFSGK